MPEAGLKTSTGYREMNEDRKPVKEDFRMMSLIVLIEEVRKDMMNAFHWLVGACTHPFKMATLDRIPNNDTRLSPDRYPL